MQMGLMLSLDWPAPARSRRQAQHARGTCAQASMAAAAVVQRRGAAGRVSYLSRLAGSVLAGRQPAGPAWLAAQVRMRKRRARRVDLALTLSVPCLLGHCRVAGHAPGCQSRDCGHDCHCQ